MVAASYLIGEGINNSFLGLRSEQRLFVYMNPTATDEQVDAVAKRDPQSGQTDDVDYLDRERTFEVFQTLFRDQPDLVSTVKPEDLPTSFQIKPESTDAEVVSSLGNSLETLEGVRTVQYAAEYAVKHPAVGHHAQHLGSLRRRDPDHGLGATDLQHHSNSRVRVSKRDRGTAPRGRAANWFIRMPFIAEGLVHGLLGAILAAGGAIAFDSLWKRNFVDQVSFELLSQIRWDSSDLVMSIVVVVVIGALTGAIGSGIAVSRFLRV